MTVGIVTGGNRGIGFGVVKGLLKDSDLSTIVIATRKIENGEKAIQQIKSEISEAEAGRLVTSSLDLSSADSIANFAEWIKDGAWIQANYGGYDVLVCNAGIADELMQDSRSAAEKLSRTIDVNFCGTAKFMEAMYPLAYHGARIVAVSSLFALRAMFSLNSNPNKREDLTFAEETGVKLFSTNGCVPSPAELEEVSERFKADWESGKCENWPGPDVTLMPGYDMSKLLVNNLVRHYAKLSQTKEKRLLVNGVCPGFCATGTICPP